jgi:hypothetical protein
MLTPSAVISISQNMTCFSFRSRIASCVHGEGETVEINVNMRHKKKIVYFLKKIVIGFKNGEKIMIIILW